MDADWEEVGRVTLPPPGFQQVTSPVSALALDTSHELLWAGNEFGRVTSFYGTTNDVGHYEFTRYSSFKSDPDYPVRQMLFHEKGVITLSPRGVHMALRRGPRLWNIRHENMTNLTCMSFTSRATSEILVAGDQDVMFVIDVVKGEIVKQVPTEHHYAIMKKSRYICAATRTGMVNILDSTSLKVVHSWQAHSSFISDMDAQHDFIVTCGASLKQQAAQTYMLDPFVNVFDLKKMGSMAPIPFPPLAAYVRMHPRMLTTSIVFSQQGQMHVVDLMNPNTSNVRQANTMGYLTMVEIAASGEALAMADSECNIHLWGSPSKFKFAEFAQPLEFAEPEETPLPLDWSTETPLNSIGLPYYREILLSAWPSNLISDVGAPPVKFDAGFQAGLKQTEFGLYGRNSRGLRRNQVEDTRASERGSETGPAPKFLSEKARESAKTPVLHPPVEISTAKPGEPLALGELDSLKPDAPAMYRNFEIKYSKFGVDDFDFGFYNRTPYPGLENHIPNSYANSLLQVMHYTPLLRNLALQHTATACLNELCLLCELGFVFDMLQKAESSTCQATNLLKALSNQVQAGPLGLLEEEIHSPQLTSMMQGLARFLMEKISNDYRLFPPASTSLEQQLFGLSSPITTEDIVTRVLATAASNSIRCMNCRSETVRPGSTFVNELIYPVQKAPARGGRATRTTFSQVLKLSVERETTSKGWCSRCTRYQTLQTRKTVHNVPAVFVLNAAVTNADHRRLWATPGWLPEEIGIIVDQGQFFCYEGEDLKLHLQRGIHHITVYSLVGLVANVESGQPQKPHLVGLVNVTHAEPNPPAPGDNQWHVFNDFSVRPVSSAEALTFNAAWKMPSVLVYQVKGASHRLNDEWKENIDTTVLFKELKNPPPLDQTYQLLDPVTERPGPGTIVALDTEFVSLKQSEINVNSDGEREIVRPMSHALARVSVVRGHGEDEGLPFIDDYIAIKEPIVDYLTTYSGIKPGDLDPRTSTHNLVSLKTAYKKLWVLLNLGCVFLGHGLKQDFRVINIHVPRSQIIDTIELFFLKSRLRKLSLSFLVWYLLKEEIQQHTHDSIEDARGALKLYRKYLEFEDAGIFETMLQDIYRAGRETNYRPPRKEDQVIQRTDTPPLTVEGGPGPTTPARKTTVPAQVSGPTLGSGPGWTPGKGSPLRE